jgi:hypothetical protein
VCGLRGAVRADRREALVAVAVGAVGGSAIGVAVGFVSVARSTHDCN